MIIDFLLKWCMRWFLVSGFLLDIIVRWCTMDFVSWLCFLWGLECDFCWKFKLKLSLWFLWPDNRLNPIQEAAHPCVDTWRGINNWNLGHIRINLVTYQAYLRVHSRCYRKKRFKSGFKAPTKWRGPLKSFCSTHLSSSSFPLH